MNNINLIKMRIQDLDYEPIISYFNKFECEYIKWIFVGIQVHYFLLNIYLLISNRYTNYYQIIPDNNLNKILDKLKDYILFALFEQLCINSLKNISENYFNSDLTKIIVCAIYGILSGVYWSNRDYFAGLLNIIFSFGILMIYYDFDELGRLHVNIYINSVYFQMYMITYQAIYSNQTGYLEKLNSKSTKNE